MPSKKKPIPRDPLDVITKAYPYGIGPGALGASCSHKPNGYPQAYAAFGYRLAQPLIDKGLVETFNENGSTRFRLVEPSNPEGGS